LILIVRASTAADLNRFSYWGNILEAESRALRVITLEGGETVHNAFLNRNFYE
jgi:hypothetical protein